MAGRGKEPVESGVGDLAGGDDQGKRNSIGLLPRPPVLLRPHLRRPAHTSVGLYPEGHGDRWGEEIRTSSVGKSNTCRPPTHHWGQRGGEGPCRSWRHNSSRCLSSGRCDGRDRV